MTRPRSQPSGADAGPPAVVVAKFGGSVLRRPEDIVAAVEVVARQRAAGLRPIVVVSAFEGVTDTILAAAAVLLPDRGMSLREPRHDAAYGVTGRSAERPWNRRALAVAPWTRCAILPLR